MSRRKSWLPALLVPPIFHAVHPLLDAKDEEDVVVKLDNVQLSVRQGGSSTEECSDPDTEDDKGSDDCLVAGVTGVDNELVPVQGNHTDGEGGDEGEEEWEEGC